MRVTYFADTDTTFIELSDDPPVEARELGEDLYVDLDAAGHVVSLTVEHAHKNTDADTFSCHRLPSKMSA
jgi:uncharacterized protein YuzE